MGNVNNLNNKKFIKQIFQFLNKYQNFILAPSIFIKNQLNKD